MDNEKNTTGMDLRVLAHDFLKTARQYLWLALAAVVLLSGLSCWKAKRSYRPAYEASATFTVYVSNPLQAEVRGYNAATAEQMAKTFPYILTSGALQDLVMEELGIPGMPSVSASVLNNTNIFTLRVTAARPELAYEVLNSVIRHYPDVAEFVVGPTVMSLLSESGLPTAPKNELSYGKVIEKGAVTGLVLWALLVLLLALTRSTVHNEDELGRLISVRCLSVLPQVRRGRKNAVSCPMAVEGNGDRGFSEAVRLLRVRVSRELRNREMKVLLVSSATPGEGKTTVSINLARMMAHHGERTLLVDCDLRRPTVAKDLNMENKGGLVDVLRGELKPEQAVKPGPEEKLFVTVAGGPSEQAAELLGCPEGKAFLAWCREHYDYILLDTPPVSLLSDAAEIAGAADGALLVVRQDYAPRVRIREGAEQLSESGLPLVGCVFNYAANGVLSGHSYGYGYGYGYGYDYGYGYGEASHTHGERKNGENGGK